MAQRCGWCGNSGFIGNAVCSYCPKSGKRAFPPKAKKKVRDTLDSGHRHNTDIFVSEVPSGMYFECDCGTTFKVEA